MTHGLRNMASEKGEAGSLSNNKGELRLRAEDVGRDRAEIRWRRLGGRRCS